ncbi:MAG: hypothetical protein WD294_12570, partial [Phycisphaeraceae bacterium]
MSLSTEMEDGGHATSRTAQRQVIRPPVPRARRDDDRRRDEARGDGRQGEAAAHRVIPDLARKSITLPILESATPTEQASPGPIAARGSELKGNRFIKPVFPCGVLATML